MPPLSPRMRSLFLVFAATFLVRGQDADLAERLFRSGERAYAGKSYVEAMGTWNQLLQQSPSSPFAAEALLRMARHQLDVEKKPAAALPILDRLRNEYIKTPQAADALLLRGVILAAKATKAQDLREAIGEFNRVVDLFPDHPALQAAQLRLGLAARLQGQWGRALQNFAEAIRLDPASPIAPQAQLHMAAIQDVQGDLMGCLGLLQNLRNRWPDSPEAQEAAWQIAVRVKHRIQKPAFRSEGPWPGGKVKWLKTPTLLATGPKGELYIYQSDLDQVFRLNGTDVKAVGSPLKDVKALTVAAENTVWMLGKTGVVREDPTQPWVEPAVTAPTGAFLDGWGLLWVSDSKLSALSLMTPPDGAVRSIPSPTAVGLAPLPNGGAVMASDANRSLLFLDAAGQPKNTVPYGKGLPATFKYVLSLCSDPTGHVAAIVDGDFEGVVLWGPDGTVLRQATFKALGLNRKYRAIALDRQGGIILADRSNDLLIRLN